MWVGTSKPFMKITDTESCFSKTLQIHIVPSHICFMQGSGSGYSFFFSRQQISKILLGVARLGFVAHFVFRPTGCRTLARLLLVRMYNPCFCFPRSLSRDIYVGTVSIPLPVLFRQTLETWGEQTRKLYLTKREFNETR